ncbi:hypothetical protein G9C85_12305 [Halorubellus sp. JP-L1]|uniref:hypothetical protein n=1 Tax=Halorubellus sp. JP-L1 TaxID=2715753 RepID=UPI00140800E3|nr:hypothetical protein [Halorubellus sp. JP-L1]NHN42402.1 hypothetical protein [Halorubellus sp. JP-L1]
MATETTHALALAALAACATALLSVPVLVAPLSTATTVAAVAAVAVAVAGIVLVVARDLRRGPNWPVRLYRSGLVAAVASFFATTALTPPDPLSQVRYGAPALGVGLLLAHVAVAYDVDRAIVTRIR